jgi:spore coat polysaccharide biosynthesis protein SpsF
MKTAIFLSIREKATRLPKKVLLEIKGKTVTEHLIDRLKMAKLPDIIVLCTSTNPNDTVLVDIAKKNNIEYFRGSEDDKLDRYYHAALKFEIDFMIIVDGDDIFCDPECIDNIIRRFKETNADYLRYNDLPVGVTAHGIKIQALKKLLEIKDQINTEVWAGYFTDTGLFNVVYLEPDEELKHPEIRMTLDYIEDFRFFEEVFERLYKPKQVFSLSEILKLLEEKPEIADINKDAQEKFIKITEEARKKIKIKKGKK